MTDDLAEKDPIIGGLDAANVEAEEDMFRNTGIIVGTWNITEDALADWALRKIRMAKDSLLRRQDTAEEQILKWKTWLEEESKDDEATIRFFETKLRMYFEAQRAAGALGKKKSYGLPNGKLVTRKVQPKYKYDDADLIAYLKETHPKFVNTTVVEKAQWGEFKKTIELQEQEDGSVIAVDTGTGEILGFVDVTPEDEEFKVEV